MRRLYTIVLLFLTGLAFTSCDKKSHPFTSHFTKADSLTDYYLRLQDTLHQQWNIMINDDNQKIKAMQHLVHELIVTNPDEDRDFAAFEERLNQLMRLRYTQKSMVNKDVIREYDHASNELIIELIAAAEQKREYAYNSTLQKLVSNILSADQRMMNYRLAYDSLVGVFNRFVDQNKDHLLESDHSLSLEKKPEFQMTSVD
jgi:hypothetical protein